MEKENKKLIYEFLLINNSYHNELSARGNDIGYSRYHQQNADWYSSFTKQIGDILGFKGSTEDEAVSYLSTIELTSEQKRGLMALRREPMFKKLLGKTALAQKQEIEQALGTTISQEGVTFADENGARISIKSIDVLDKELNDNGEKLDALLSSGQLSREQYDSYKQSLDYIYDYYMSQSRGEQIPFRKMSDSEYSKIDEMAQENGINFDEQLREINQDMRYDFEQVQEVAHRNHR